MNTKSTIQLLAEQIELSNRFFDNLQQLNESYNIKNNVFACSAKGQAEELKEGYYGEVRECEDIKDLRKDFNIYLQGVRVCEGKMYVGNLYKNLSDVKEMEVYDLKAGQKITLL